MSLFTPEILKWILKRKPDAQWGAARFARDPDLFKGKINQINRIWDELPADFQKKLKPNLLSSTERSFRGAFSELIAYLVLRRWYTEIRCDPHIGTHTPDFHVIGQDGKRAFIAEVFSLGPHETHKAYRWAVARLTKALKNFESPYHLSFLIPPKMSTSLDWLREKLEAYLEKYIDVEDTEKVHTVESEGQHVFFHVGPKANESHGLFGYLSQTMSGDPQVKNITDRLEQKVEKYKFPFLAVCVTDSLGTADRHSLMQALLGHIHTRVTVNLEGSQTTPQESSWTFADDGFWGVGNPKISEHLGVQGFLFVEPQYDQDMSFSLHVSLVENPHIHASLGTDMIEVPDLLRSVRENGTYEIPGFKFKP